jgi:hypothetical protein
MGRVLLFGAAWIALVGAVAVAISRPPPRAKASTETPHATSSSRAPAPHAGERHPGWIVTRAYSAHHMMVVEIEADGRPKTPIAAQIVEPLKDRFDEVLIYIREAGQHAQDLPARRIQWTPRGGYIETVFGR